MFMLCTCWATITYVLQFVLPDKTASVRCIWKIPKGSEVAKAGASCWIVRSLCTIKHISRGAAVDGYGRFVNVDVSDNATLEASNSKLFLIFCILQVYTG